MEVGREGGSAQQSEGGSERLLGRLPAKGSQRSPLCPRDGWSLVFPSHSVLGCHQSKEGMVLAVAWCWVSEHSTSYMAPRCI